MSTTGKKGETGEFLFDGAPYINFDPNYFPLKSMEDLGRNTPLCGN